MNDELVTIYKCSDGTDFPVHWSEPADATFVWWRNEEHWPLVEGPLIGAIRELSVPERHRIFQEAGLQTPSSQAKEISAQGYPYLTPPRAPDNEAHELGIEALLAKWGGLREVYRDYCLPTMRGACQSLQDEAGEWTLLQLTNAWARGLFPTFVAGQAARHIITKLTAFLTAEMGEEGKLLPLALTGGRENATTDGDQALWELADLTKQFPAVRDAIVDTDGDVQPDGLKALDGGKRFLDAFENFLALFGWRTETWQIVAPTWREQPWIPLGLVRGLVRQGLRSPMEAMRETATRREVATRDTLTRLASSKQEEFQRLLDAAEGYIYVREGRALWQLNAYGSMRYALLLRGARLRDAGLLEAAEEVFFLLPEEMEAALVHGTKPPQDILRERKREHAYWQSKEPPELIGAVAISEAAPSPVGENAVLTGAGASRGILTARARVIGSVPDGERLNPGEVLVCHMTSPAWTPLFAIAGAVVTDLGGVLGHTSITAREYGIPCVVATTTATKDISDGALIRVDGTAGTVEMLSS